jgi:hypothetical protein
MESYLPMLHVVDGKVTMTSTASGWHALFSWLLKLSLHFQKTTYKHWYTRRKHVFLADPHRKIVYPH